MFLYLSSIDESPSVVSSTSTQRTSDQPQIVHSFSEPYQLSESPKCDIDRDIPFDLKPTITITTTTSTQTSTTCSMESMAESQSNTASETLQTSNSHSSSTTEVDVVQEARSPCPSKPVRVHIQYPCSLYQDSNYLPPKKLSSMIEEMIKDGMPRLMRKIVAETKLAHKIPSNIFNFDNLPQKQDTIPSPSITDATTKDFDKLVDSVDKDIETAEVAKTSYTLSDPPDTSNVCQAPSSDNDDEMVSDNSVVDQHPMTKKRSATLPSTVTDLIQSSKLQRSHSLMSERRRMEIFRNMSQSVKDRLRRHSSSAATSSTPSNLDVCPISPNDSPVSSPPTTGSQSSSPKNYSVNITISNKAKNPHHSQLGDEPFVPAPKNKVRRWISFNYGDKTTSKVAQKYMKHMEQKPNH